KALCISANAHARQAYAAMLTSWGYQAVLIDPAEGGLSKCRSQFAASPTADVLIVDISTASPRELDLVDELQRTLDAAVPIIGLVAPTAEGEVTARCQELGIEPCLTKPVKTQELQDAINSAIPRRRESRHAVRGDVNRSPAQHPRLRILVADDSP